ncbi:MAG: GNAT family N-acetyltransferase [Geminicoccaceae bacterium]
MISILRPSAISIRTVGPFDLGRLSRLHRSCFEEAWSRSDLAHLLAMPGGFGLVARLFEGGLAGLDAMRGVGFSLCRIVRDECELLSIGVSPAYRRRRVAERMLHASMDRCYTAGAQSMFLEVAVDNLPAQRLYEINGFEQVGIRPDYYQRADGTRASAFTMRCDLARQIGREGQPALQTVAATS